MDRSMILDHLAQARCHVAMGEKHIASQREVIAALERNGYDTSGAEELLATFEELQRMHVADQDRLQNKLSKSSK